MKNGKQAKQVIILAGLLLALTIAAIVQFKGGSAPPPAKKSSAPAPVEQLAVEKDTPAGTTKAGNGLDWVDSRRIPGLVAEAAAGRNPFIDLMARAESTVPTETPKPIVKNQNPSHPIGGDVLPPGARDLGRWPYPTTMEVAPPPPPAFQVPGVIASGKVSYATILLDGQQYTLRKGEMIPTCGWTVQSINPKTSTVVLTNGTQTVTLRSTGGSPK